MVEQTTRLFLRPNTRLKAFTDPVHCQNLSKNGHRGTTKSFSGQTQDQIMSFCSRQHKTNYFIIYLFILLLLFFSRANTSSGRAHEKKNSQFEHTTKNPQKPKYFSGSIHDQTFSQVDHTNKNLLRGTNNSKMLLGCNTAGRERHESNQPQEKSVRQTNWKFRVIADQMALKH